MKVCVAVVAMALAVTGYASAAREQVMGGAMAYWNLGGPTSGRPVVEMGRVERGVKAEGKGAIAGSLCARLENAWFDAGKDLRIAGDKVTVYIRAYDPQNRWDYGLFAKRGNQGMTNYNLFSTHGIIGFEVITEQGGGGKSFPISLLGPNSWHDIIGRYDGVTLDIFCDGLRMVRLPWRGGALRQNDEPTLIGAETDGPAGTKAVPVRPFTGDIQEAAIWGRALTDAEIATVMRVKGLKNGPGYREANTYISRLQQRPDVGVFGDPIPFYWNGEYHVFYLYPSNGVVWNHISTKDFITWKKHPVAIRPDGAPNGPDGFFMFTGSIVEKDGVFHCYYTGHNPNNPEGLEFIMHATSTDLETWTKHPEDMVRPDGKSYRIGTKSAPDKAWIPQDWNFRDPYVFFNEDEGCYWLLFLGEDPATAKLVQGLATSKDLKTWEFQKPLDAPFGQECPDAFKIGARWYLTGGAQYLAASSPRGPYTPVGDSIIDMPGIYAGKRMFDGKRHIWVGWVRDKEGGADSGALQWGGSQCLPREIYADSDGALCYRPARELASAFKKTVIDLKGKPAIKSNSAVWKAADGALVGKRNGAGSQVTFDAPANYMLDCVVKMGKGSTFEVSMRESGADGYRLVIDTAAQKVSLRGASFSVDRNVRLEADKPIHITAFVLGTTIEAFVDDRYALTSRAYDFPSGKLGLSVSGGEVVVSDLTVRVEK